MENRITGALRTRIHAPPPGSERLSPPRRVPIILHPLRCSFRPLRSPRARMARRVVLLGSLLLLSLWPGRAFAQLTAARQATMPAVVGLTEDQARARLQQFQLSIDVTPVASAQPQGTVVAQRPGPGTAIKQGARAVLSVSRGPDRQQEQPDRQTDGGSSSREARVPDLTGMTPTLARIALIAARLIPGSIDSADAPGVRAGRVVGQRPEAGAVVPAGTRVQLTLARRAPAAEPTPQPPAPDPPPPPRPTLVAVPDLAGRTVAEARRATGGARLLLGEVDSIAASGTPGTVVRQRPAAGDSVQPGTFVSITVARQALVTVPRLAGRSPSAARGELIRAGLRPGTLTEREAAGEPSVLEQSVAAGSRVTPGTVVNLVVSHPPHVAPTPPPAPPPLTRPDSPAVAVAPPPPAPPAVDSAPAARIDSVLPPAVVPAPPAVVAPVAPPAVRADTPRPTPSAAGPALRWEWLAGLAALLLLVLAAALLLRSRARRATPRTAPPVAAAPVPIVTVRAATGETRTAAGPESPVGKGRVKVGFVMGDSRTPEPEAGSAALAPARVVVRMETEDEDALGAHPQRVLAGGPARVSVAAGEPTLTRDEGAVILKRR
jgi:beta-lactam-binding protein with PASTA domain